MNTMQNICTFGNAGNLNKTPSAARLGTACWFRLHSKPKTLNRYCSLNCIVSLESSYLVFFSLLDTAHRRHGKWNRWAVTGIRREKWKDFSSYCLLLLKHICLLGLNSNERSMCLKFWLYCIFLEKEYWFFLLLLKTPFQFFSFCFVCFISGVLSQVGRDTGWIVHMKWLKVYTKATYLKMQIKIFFKSYLNC